MTSFKNTTCFFGSFDNSACSVLLYTSGSMAPLISRLVTFGAFGRSLASSL
eukprot:CAMPEP_0181427516 /NCGR_PEP_ID=MMETSP1110-20121109/16212_1 /TAXON_ID=174948 /ORGANISM="Symbiodinium sp., Strain CCMP421" /LENGTH=50 /DNA_ID=CAMNT_0023550731 /DNA_START=344 /DNA_END=496 /DNA_ORIENTATION=-